MTIINIIIYSILLCGFAWALSYVLILKKRVKQSAEIQLQLLLDKNILLSKLSEALTALEEKPLVETDGFLKFITESRDYAFQFIDTMQKSIQEFEVNTKDIFTNSDNDDVKKILVEYEVLKSKTLPNDLPNN